MTFIQPHYVQCEVGFLRQCPQCIEDFMRFPSDVQAHCMSVIRRVRRENTDYGYFITYTLDPQKARTHEQWIARLKIEMSRKFVRSFKMVIENRDTNKHAHAYVRTNTLVKKGSDFHTYNKYFGMVDVRKVENDNGVDDYLGVSVGAEVFTDVEQII